MQSSSLEADDASARIGQREEQAALEVVVALPGETCLAQLLSGETLLVRLAREQPALGREAETELATDLLAEAAAREVVARERARRRVPQHPLVEGRGLVEELVEALAAETLRVFPRRRLLVFERDAEALGKPLDRSREVEALRLPDEAEEVAALAAAEAVVQPLTRVDREARRPLLVERAATGQMAARLAQRGALLDDGDEVCALTHRLDARVLDPSHYRVRA